jgi:hypothetical protein
MKQDGLVIVFWHVMSCSHIDLFSLLFYAAVWEVIQGYK